MQTTIVPHHVSVARVSVQDPVQVPGFEQGFARVQLETANWNAVTMQENNILWGISFLSVKRS